MVSLANELTQQYLFPCVKQVIVRFSCEFVIYIIVHAIFLADKFHNAKGLREITCDENRSVLVSSISWCTCKKGGRFGLHSDCTSNRISPDSGFRY